MIDFVKNLSASEAKYKYVGLPKTIREKFPEKNKIFKVNFKGKTYEMKVNNKNCIMLTQLYEKYEFVEDDEILIVKVKKDIYDLTVNSTP